MAESGFFRRHGAFVLFSLLVLCGGLYMACGTAADDLGSMDAGGKADARKDDGATSNR